jgi:glycosyltransferase involved in cell wall biosynthesis
MRLSVVIPAWNEEQLLPACLESVYGNLGNMPGLEIELIVVDNNSADRTAAVAEQNGARVVFEAVNQIARARNAGAAAATGQWLLFLDADSRLNPGLAAELRQVLVSGRRVGCGSTMYMSGLPWWAYALMRWWNGLSRLCQWAAGSFLACRTDAFRAVGGFSEELYAAEEIDLSRRLKRWGRARGQYFPVLHRYPLLTSSRKLRLYTGREIAAQLGRLIARPWRSLHSRDALGLWYDGRR